MKKVSKIILSLLFCLTAVFAVSACGKAKIVSANVKVGTLATTVVKGDQDFTTANTVVVFVYDNKDKKEVPATELKFSEIDINKAEEQTLTITYEEEDYSFDVKIKVVASEADVNSIEQLESELLNDYNSKREATDEQVAFKNQNEPLYVGDDNKFNFRIVASGVDGAGNQVDLDQNSKIRTNIKVEEITGTGNNKTYTLLEGDALNNLVKLDTENTTLDFEAVAIGRHFRITVSAVNADEVYEEYTYFVAEDIEVVDGYNVYEEYELALYDNYREKGGTESHFPDWTNFKSTHNLTGITVNGLVLQRDLSIEKGDVTSDLFWTENSPNYAEVRAKVPANIEFLGTPIDNSDHGIYNRIQSSGEIFNFIGNYFQVSLKDFPKMVIERGNATADSPVGLGYVSTVEGQEEFITAHLSVFHAGTLSPESINAKTEVNYKNFNFFGNGELNGKPENSGAILLMKNDYINCNAYNTVMNYFYVGYFFEYGNKVETANHNPYIGQFVVDSCKGYYSYQCLFYIYGAEHVIIKNSEFMTSGGPAIIADHVISENDYNKGYITKIDVINSHIESKINSQSPWFSNYGMSQYLADLALIEGVFNGQATGGPASGSTVIPGYEKDDYGNNIPMMDMVALFKANGISIGARAQGYIRFFESETDYNKHYGLKGETKENITYGLDMDETTKHWNGKNMAALALENGAHFIEGAVSGHFLNDKAEVNKLTNAMGGTLKCDGLYGAIQQFVGQALGAEYVQYVTIDGYASMNLAQKQTALKQVVAFIKQQGFVEQLYTVGHQNGLFQEISGTTADERLAGVCAQIDSWVDVPNWSGEYCNVYTAMGMGLVFRLYPATASN